MTTPDLARVALVTGGSRGLGRALTAELVSRGWHVVIDGRDSRRLADVVDALVPAAGTLIAVTGDVADPAHRGRLADTVATMGRLDLLVNNASVLGPSPQPRLADYPLDELEQVYAVNTIAPLGLAQLVLPYLEKGAGVVINVTSDAAVEAYQGWGGYGSAKAALDHVSAVLAAEHPRLRVYAFDPGDMATDLQQQAFPGEDVSDRAAPEAVVPAMLVLVGRTLPSGRYRASDVVATR